MTVYAITLISAVITAVSWVIWLIQSASPRDTTKTTTKITKPISAHTIVVCYIISAITVILGYVCLFEANRDIATTLGGVAGIVLMFFLMFYLVGSIMESKTAERICAFLASVRERIKADSQVAFGRLIAAQELNSYGYSTRKEILQKSIFIQGNDSTDIYEEIVRRYCKAALSKRMSITQIREGLSRCIYSIDSNPLVCEKHREAVTRVAEKYGIHNVAWEINSVRPGNSDFIAGFVKIRVSDRLTNPA